MLLTLTLESLGLIPAHAGKTRTVRYVPCTPWAHPRSRGENEAGPHDGVPAVGSSPLTRGKLLGVVALKLPGGLIPAHAGKTTPFRVPTTVRPAHPRSRGENSTGSWRMRRSQGSSPLTRGKLLGVVALKLPGGLIPAHAGKTTPFRVPTTVRPAHPRSRGENSTGSWRMRRSQGSSPLTRGKRLKLATCLASRGLIPAHAGKTGRSRGRALGEWAHPRSRGENGHGL